MQMVEKLNEILTFRLILALTQKWNTSAHDLKGAMHDEILICLKKIFSPDNPQHANIQILKKTWHPISMNNICGNFKRTTNTLPWTKKLVNYEFVQRKPCNNCIISKPVDMQVYNIEKCPWNARFQGLETLFVVDVTLCIKRAKRDKQGLFLYFANVLNVTLWVNDFQGKTSTLRGPERLCQSPPCNAQRAGLAAFDKIRNIYLLTYAQMTA